MEQQNTQEAQREVKGSINFNLLKIKIIRVKLLNLDTNKTDIISYTNKDLRAEEDIEDFNRCKHLKIVWIKEKEISFYENLLRKEKLKLRYHTKKWKKAILDFKNNNEDLKRKLWDNKKEVETYINHIEDKIKEQNENLK